MALFGEVAWEFVAALANEVFGDDDPEDDE